ncbi:hypothetical protein R1sor_000805 [Riccia sorocarpa]|uniref:phosphoribosylaminoimidazole carboxylase n=1 Tax=Riccia sorocarpa TaxID=122646 RepID=A0ABD3GUF8_9MARC
MDQGLACASGSKLVFTGSSFESLTRSNSSPVAFRSSLLGNSFSFVGQLSRRSAESLRNRSSIITPRCSVSVSPAERDSEGSNGLRMASGQEEACGAHLCTSAEGLCDTVVGVLGGGQLGRMLCQAASPMGIRVAVLDPMENCPASSIAYRHAVGSFRDTNAVREFAKGCGVLTVEIEHVDVDTLDALAKEGVDVEPKPSTIRIIQDKYLQKVHFSKQGVALPEFMKIDNEEGAEEAGRIFGYPLMLKSRRLAYDGRGNAVVRSRDELANAVSLLGGYERGLYAEKWAPFVKELAVMVARGRDGSVSSFPVVETTHKDNICHTVEAPARVSPDVAKIAMSTAEKAIKSLDGAGVFGVELFLLADGQVLLNEVAPRPHNSGHYTIEACFVSQYEQHLRAVLGLPLGDPSMKVPAALMYNLLGEDDGEAGFALAHQLLHKAVSVPGASVHWYEKPEIRKQRKMGHITFVGPTASVVRARLNSIISNTGSNNNGSATTAPKSLAARSSDSNADVTAAVGIIMGSDSDLPVMKAAAEILEEFGVPYELTVVSAHRTPERMVSYAQQAYKRGVKVIIAGAGGAAHLPGMVAALSPLPVIGVPVKGSSTDGMDSLLSIVQMPRGIPVATVAINNATNAGLLAVRMLGVADSQYIEKMLKYQDSLKDMVLEKVEKLERVGWQEYLR